jgi:hypothetical protein
MLKFLAKGCIINQKATFYNQASAVVRRCVLFVLRGQQPAVVRCLMIDAQVKRRLKSKPGGICHFIAVSPTQHRFTH